MLSFCRSGLLALTLVSGSIADVHAQIQRMSHQAWISDVGIERLQDKSVLTEYYGESPSKEHQDVIFRIGFIPRFGCAPLITLMLGKAALTEQRSDTDPARFPADLSGLVINIDGARFLFPALVDNDDGNASVYMNANLQRRLTARLRIETGNRLDVRFKSGKKLNFSLMGSRDAISIANQNCRRHDPTIQG